MAILLAKGNYFEGILQIRGCKDEADDLINEQLRKSGAYASRVVNRKEGKDVYISDQHFLQNLGKKLKTRFGGTLTTSRKLHTMDKQRSKRLYRVTVMFRMPAFHASDVISAGRKTILVRKIAKTVTGIDLDTGRQVSVPYEQDAAIHRKEKSKVMKIVPSLEVMHPETYQSVKAKNPFRHDLSLGENVKIVVHKEIYVI